MPPLAERVRANYAMSSSWLRASARTPRRLMETKRLRLSFVISGERKSHNAKPRNSKIQSRCHSISSFARSSLEVTLRAMTHRLWLLFSLATTASPRKHSSILLSILIKARTEISGKSSVRNPKLDKRIFKNYKMYLSHEATCAQSLQVFGKTSSYSCLDFFPRKSLSWFINGLANNYYKFYVFLSRNLIY